MKLKWICSVPSSDKRRKVYQVTATGQEIIKLETQRIQKLHHIAKELGFKEEAMIRHKLFTSLQEEEHWINSIQSEGYQLVKVTPWTATYHFEKCSRTPHPVRLDFHEHIAKGEYSNYLSLFEDCGWQPIQGSRRCGIHYFQQTIETSSTEIFLIPNRKSILFTLPKLCLLLFRIISDFIFIHYQVGLQNGYTLWNPKSWYLTPGLWERTGTSFGLVFSLKPHSHCLEVALFPYFSLLGLFISSISLKKVKRSEEIRKILMAYYPKKKIEKS